MHEARKFKAVSRCIGKQHPPTLGGMPKHGDSYQRNPYPSLTMYRKQWAGIRQKRMRKLRGSFSNVNLVPAPAAAFFLPTYTALVSSVNGTSLIRLVEPTVPAGPFTTGIPPPTLEGETEVVPLEEKLLVVAVILPL